MSKSAFTAENSAIPVSDTEAATLFAALDATKILILAVSGGPDSTAMMVLAGRWCAARRDSPALIAVTVDHGLRAESASEANTVSQIAQSLGLAHRTLRWDGTKPVTGLHEAARLARYGLLAAAARDCGARHVLTAHTLDDQAETILMRLARGSGLSGLAGMRTLAPMPVPEGADLRLFRPLLGVPKVRLVATLQSAHIPFANDPTNHDTRFTRPRLRELMPALTREGLTAERLATLARRAARSEAALLEMFNETLQRLAPEPWPTHGPVVLQADAFSRLPDEIALRIIERVISRIGDEGPTELGKLEILCDALSVAIKGSSGHRFTGSVPPGQGLFRRTLAGAIVTLSDERITIERAPPRASRTSQNQGT